MRSVELTSQVHLGDPSGIGRYVTDLYSLLQDRISIKVTGFSYLPGINRFGMLKNFPIGVAGHQEGAIVHIAQILGASLLLWWHHHPAIVTVHDLGFLEWPEEGKMLGVIGRHLLRLSLAGLSRADYLIAVSDFTRRGLIGHLHISPDKIVSIHNGIALGSHKPLPNAREVMIQKYPQLSAKGSPWLLYVGSELPRKNISGLLLIVSGLRKYFPRITLIKIGSSGGEKYRKHTLQLIEALNLNNQVIFFDLISDSDLYSLYQSADLLIHPSKMEGFCFPILEAFANALPVICSNSGALPEVSADAAILHPPDDNDAFINSAVRLFEDPQYKKQVVGRGLLRSKQFSLESTVASMISIYKSLE